ncbi:MAG: type II toxin-antitoxin system HicB family antitoxin [Firmicutes bacterium]|jgi:predicted RNase H-like HicB family nuclease|nr:type II toxin-antitoxin system HicB family antitoxin [Bacillota bacterium]
MSHPVRLTAAITHEGDWYVARCLEVEVASQGSSLDEAIDNLREALELYFDDIPMQDLPVTPILAPVTIEMPHP